MPEKRIRGVRLTLARATIAAVPADDLDVDHGEVHRHLATEAAENGVSLNRLASAKLAH